MGQGERGMIGEVARTAFLDLTVVKSAAMRARRYREEAARFRRMAQIEDIEKVRAPLLSLAEQYDELATDLESHD